MNGRRVRGVKPSKIYKMNREIQSINESIVDCCKLLDSLERTVYPGDWLKGHITEPSRYQTWRTVGYLFLTDHFVARYFERILGIKIHDDTLEKFWNKPIGLNERDNVKIRYLYETGKLTDKIKSDIREFVKNPPEGVRIIRQEEKVITVLV